MNAKSPREKERIYYRFEENDDHPDECDIVECLSVASLDNYNKAGFWRRHLSGPWNQLIGNPTGILAYGCRSFAFILIHLCLEPGRVRMDCSMNTGPLFICSVRSRLWRWWRGCSGASDWNGLTDGSRAFFLRRLPSH